MPDPVEASLDRAMLLNGQIDALAGSESDIEVVCAALTMSLAEYAYRAGLGPAQVCAQFLKLYEATGTRGGD